MQSVTSRIWTRVIVFISYDDNHYITGTSHSITFPSGLKCWGTKFVNLTSLPRRFLEHELPYPSMAVKMFVRSKVIKNQIRDVTNFKHFFVLFVCFVLLIGIFEAIETNLPFQLSIFIHVNFMTANVAKFSYYINLLS